MRSSVVTVWVLAFIRMAVEAEHSTLEWKGSNNAADVKIAVLNYSFLANLQKENGRMDPSKAVAAYTRSDAGAGHGEAAKLPSDLRTPGALSVS